MNLLGMINWFLQEEADKYALGSRVAFVFIHVGNNGKVVRSAIDIPSDGLDEAATAETVGVVFTTTPEVVDFAKLKNENAFGCEVKLMLEVKVADVSKFDESILAYELVFYRGIDSNAPYPCSVPLEGKDMSEQSLLNLAKLPSDTLFWPEHGAPKGELSMVVKLKQARYIATCDIAIPYSLSKLNENYQPTCYDVLISKNHNELEMKPVCRAIAHNGCWHNITLGDTVNMNLIREVDCG